ncbi:hypothetical protein ABH942_000379 [Flavobacterium sp. 28YEA47A]|uniref:hypothetical protein n=1 Tax=Flavobacterium sp. 28YEA47A TaxID=3156276 RepID=UPI003519C1EA
MKQRANLLKSLLLIWSLLLLSCQTDEIQESTENFNSESPVVRKQFKEFGKLSGLLSEALPKDLTLAARNSNSNAVYQFEIDSTSVTQITNNGIEYYTMAVTRETMEEGTFENLVVFDVANEKKAVLIKYKPDDAYFSRRMVNPEAQFTGKYNMTEISRSAFLSRSSSATKCFISTHLYCTNNNPPTLAGPGCYKNKDGGAHVKSVASINCFEIVVNTPEPYLENTLISDPVSDAGGGNPDIAIPITTQPVFLGNIQFSFIRHLTPEQKDWWDSPANLRTVTSIINHLDQNTFNGRISPEAMAFTRKLIDYSIATGFSFEFDGTIEPAATRTINSIEELAESLNQLQINSVAIEQQPNASNTFLGSYKFKINFLTGLRMNVKFSVSRQQRHTVTNVTSEEYGASLGEWTQKDYFVDILSNGNIKIEVAGSMKYDYSIEGWGIKVFKGIRLTLILNPSDATIISSEWRYN